MLLSPQEVKSVILVTVISLFFSSVAFAQPSGLDQKMTLTIENRSVEEALDLISQQIDYSFNYTYTYEERKITKSYRDIRVAEVLRDIWGSNAIKLKVSGKTINIREEIPKPLKKPGRVRGHILDASGEPLAYVTVGLKGTTLGVITDAAGKFTLSSVAAGAQTLVISAMGYAPREVGIMVPEGQTTEVKVSLTEAANELDEVIVFGKTVTQE